MVSAECQRTFIMNSTFTSTVGCGRQHQCISGGAIYKWPPAASLDEPICVNRERT